MLDGLDRGNNADSAHETRAKPKARFCAIRYSMSLECQLTRAKPYPAGFKRAHSAS
jgi:hypothetical protein